MTSLTLDFPTHTPNNMRPFAVVVEDDPAIRQLIARALAQLNVQTQGFGSGEAALAWIEVNRPPDLVSLDLVLPWMCGVRVCESLRTCSRTRHVPIIVLTGRTDIQDEAAAIEAGADAFIEKPFRIRTYLDEVRRLIQPQPEEHALAAF